MDISNGHDMYESFRSYQTALLAEFDRLSVEYGFQTIDASAEPMFVFAQLKSRILNILEQDSRKAYISKLLEHPVETSVERSETGNYSVRHGGLKGCRLRVRTHGADFPRASSRTETATLTCNRSRINTLQLEKILRGGVLLHRDALSLPSASGR